MLATVAGHSERVFDISYQGDRVITCGVKHIRFWTLLGNTLQFTEGIFGKTEAQTLLCIGYFPPAGDKTSSVTTDAEPICFTGGINGDLYIWKKNKIDRINPRAHDVSDGLMQNHPDTLAMEQCWSSLVSVHHLFDRHHRRWFSHQWQRWLCQTMEQGLRAVGSPDPRSMPLERYGK